MILQILYIKYNIKCSIKLYTVLGAAILRICTNIRRNKAYYRVKACNISGAMKFYRMLPNGKQEQRTNELNK